MGTLDDAIREHLELKRQQGASDHEIEQKEQEAFGKGTARRAETPEPSEPAPAREEVELDDPFSPEDELAAAEPQRNGRPSDEEELEPQYPAPPDPVRDADEIFEPDEVPSEEALDPELQVRDERAEGDVLQETPEFLEETPEHDRLWFEQRPPKDFDFD